MSAHTAGPWTLITGAHCPIVQRGRAGGCQIEGDDPNVELADARLIAAAPELLAAAELVVKNVDDFQCGCSVKERASGHRVDCSMPAILDALQAVRAAIAATHASAPPSP